MSIALVITLTASDVVAFALYSQYNFPAPAFVTLFDGFLFMIFLEPSLSEMSNANRFKKRLPVLIGELLKSSVFSNSSVCGNPTQLISNLRVLKEYVESNTEPEMIFGFSIEKETLNRWRTYTYLGLLTGLLTAAGFSLGEIYAWLV